MKSALVAVLTFLVPAALPPLAGAQGINAPIAQPSPAMGFGPSNPVVNTPSGPEVGVGGTQSYEQPSGVGGGGIMTPNSNGTSTIIAPNGATQTVPTPR